MTPKKFLDQQYIFTASDGSEWAVPVAAIVVDRCKYRAKIQRDIYPSTDNIIWTDFLNDIIAEFQADPYELHDWAANNINWSDIEFHAICVKRPLGADMEDAWGNGKWRIGIESEVE